MPLNVLWGYTVFNHLGELPRFFYALWAVSGVSVAATLFFSWQHVIENHSRLEENMEKEGHAYKPFHLALAQTICTLPAFTSILAFTTMFVPATALAMEMVIAIFASIVIGCLTQYALLALGTPPMPKRLMQFTPEKRWWCGSLCGGVAEMTPYFGLCLSRTPHKMTLSGLRLAFRMVEAFIWSFIILSVWNVTQAMVPASVQKVDGWCYSTQWLKAQVEIVTGVAAIWSTFVGSTGLMVISNVVSAAIGESLDKEIQMKRKVNSGLIYLNLPLLKVLLDIMNTGYPTPTVPYSVSKHTVIGNDGTWTTSGVTLQCPVFDRKVMSNMFYCVFITVLMAHTAYINKELYPQYKTSAKEELQRALEARLAQDAGDERQPLLAEQDGEDI
eukprot:TRINITY_DN15004_c0_g1_i1.p1 TRINITY_DN15004_c0_g1~~TRINITY_DN15004_c0_g1_i1.p1  ORF type:complete len:387 (-),score=76.29 TRINITY_DN15004_c0_g1_i1:309-1469(-)